MARYHKIHATNSYHKFITGKIPQNSRKIKYEKNLHLTNKSNSQFFLLCV